MPSLYASTWLCPKTPENGKVVKMGAYLSSPVSQFLEFLGKATKLDIALPDASRSFWGGEGVAILAREGEKELFRFLK
jgi:hypothetical protein